MFWTVSVTRGSRSRFRGRGPTLGRVEHRLAVLHVHPHGRPLHRAVGAQSGHQAEVLALQQLLGPSVDLYAHRSSLSVVIVGSSQNRRTGRPRAARLLKKTGGVLLSQALASQVPSALRGLTALFGMGRGVSPSPKPPEKGERPRLHGPSKLHSSHSGYHCPLGHMPGYAKNPSSPRPISTGLLRTLPSFQIRPINLVVYQGSYSL